MKQNLIKERLENYFYQANKHIQKIQSAKKSLSHIMPLNLEKYMQLKEYEQDKLDVLIFRFSKLQDLLGRKIFRSILEYSGFDTNVSFVEILSELERSSLVDIEKWIELRDIRNAIAHEYPEDEDNIVDEITEIYNNIDYLIELSQRLQEYFDEIATKRD